MLEGNHTIGRKSIQGLEGAEGKSTVLEGNPTGEIWMKKVNLEKLELDIYFIQMKPVLQAKLVLERFKSVSNEIDPKEPTLNPDFVTPWKVFLPAKTTKLN